MKKYELIIFCIFSMFTREVFSQNDSQNHIVSTTFLDETGTRKLDVVSYYDGSSDLARKRDADCSEKCNMHPRRLGQLQGLRCNGACLQGMDASALFQ